MKNIFKGNIALTVNHLFQVLLVTYLVLLLAEELWAGVVSNYLNLNYMLALVIILGILDVFSEPQIKKQKKATKKDYLFIIILAIAGFLIIKLKTSSLGWLSWAISIIAGVLIALLSILVLEDNDNEVE
ncbi:hypothetical protein J4423_04670 [Candidatus Pacearchaeota archaeon]|nr:hypothetical protein [Candidatus Pacearchaeota archaeon]